MSDFDAIVIGGGHNGLVAGLYLARAGWDVLVLERNEHVGGAVMSSEITRPGFIHDLYSTNQNLFLGSPVYRELRTDLERHGLRYAISDHPYGNVYPDGTSLLVYGDANRTLETLRRHDARDAEGWSQLHEHYQTFKRTFLPLTQMALPSLPAAVQLARTVQRAGLRGTMGMAQIVLSSTRELGDLYFSSREAKALIATWGMHLDFGPEVSGGAMFPFAEAMADMENGMAITVGGASRMPEALAGLLREHGGEVRTQAEVSRVLTEGERAVGVELHSGEGITARRAVIANLTPTVLFGNLLADHPFPARFWEQVRRYRYGPGTMMVHLALSDKVPWTAGAELQKFAYIHIPPYVEDLVRTYAQSTTGYLPADPLLIVGQTSVVDPSRAPDGQQVLWVQVRSLPAQILGDAAGKIEGREWNVVKEQFADRVIDKLESYAPGLRTRILERAVFSPLDLEQNNPNLHGGDSVSGSHHLRQNFLWRPFPGWSTYRMPLENLWMVGAATWPGAGTNAMSGYLAARAILDGERAGRRLMVGGAAAGALLALAAARRLADRRL